MINATIAPTRLTSDSAASDNNPTEPVSKKAVVFKRIVAIAAPIDNHAYFLREDRSIKAAILDEEAPRHLTALAGRSSFYEIARYARWKGRLRNRHAGIKVHI